MLSLKYKKLCEFIKSKKKVLIAFSGGVDSSLLAAVAYRILGKNAIAVTIDSPVFPRSELEDAKKIARGIGILHIIVKHNELKNKKFVKNPRDRCYFCKKEEVEILKKIAKKRGIKHILFGTNVDDLKDYRPGIKALREENVLSPLADLNIKKSEVRKLAKKLKLSNSEKPAMACLSSRIPYGETITDKKLKIIENAENFIRNLGIDQVRVRCHRDIARIEVPKKDFKKILNNEGKITKKFLELGFKYITLDLLGYRWGSMNK